MKYLGNLIKLSSSAMTITGETSCTITVNTASVASASTAARQNNLTPTRKSWSVEAQCLMSIASFVNIFNKFRSAIPVPISATVPDGTTPVKKLSGNIYLTRLSFAAQGRGLITLNFSGVGDGALSVE